ncbi:hypothetical protein HNQ77_003929 [Silvibacterium bohemicum]|uniref:Uncharacterized protein n=1 Tax=Silvibacterium bohemicum TaxID=1577686 RepID=A0A841K1Y8_9BACT|nr:hypothetical protein [Silvibacterium bohemicum]
MTKRLTQVSDQLNHFGKSIEIDRYRNPRN